MAASLPTRFLRASCNHAGHALIPLTKPYHLGNTKCPLLPIRTWLTTASATSSGLKTNALSRNLFSFVKPSIRGVSIHVGFTNVVLIPLPLPPSKTFNSCANPS